MAGEAAGVTPGAPAAETVIAARRDDLVRVHPGVGELERLVGVERLGRDLDRAPGGVDVVAGAGGAERADRGLR